MRPILCPRSCMDVEHVQRALDILATSAVPFGMLCIFKVWSSVTAEGDGSSE